MTSMGRGAVHERWVITTDQRSRGRRCRRCIASLTHGLCLTILAILTACRKGLQMLPQALEAKLKDKIKTGWKLEAVSKKSDGTFELKYR